MITPYDWIFPSILLYLKLDLTQFSFYINNKKNSKFSKSKNENTNNNYKEKYWTEFEKILKYILIFYHYFQLDIKIIDLHNLIYLFIYKCIFNINRTLKNKLNTKPINVDRQGQCNRRVQIDK